ncbi:MAG: competence/damage-inducible protein A [Deltaproteobacteria bacterium]|nr:competence/damage-inducible protein A [Deltaproteobacteria bacterium]NND30536.1 competence/damage-inducible protein A [Myxococcales bacterium]MBT8465646.1 competence/damage-inducible protein A [Deltaproteobacteria bacterium]MBT8482516.1 competence/damage-inducible protein A [Deltaproteobacteria bacterium]NNK09287.1 competence/damage-inducible protein A [Myxococcales bacterium]
MTAAVLSIGTELTRGELVNTNAAWLGEELTKLGFDVVEHATVDDQLERIVTLIRRFAETNKVVVVTGGLGPTSDDLTTMAAAAAAGVQLCRDESVVEGIRQKFKAFGRVMPESNAKQGDFPQGAQVLPNPVGTAPGFALSLGDARFFFVPGVPREMKHIFHESIVPAITGLAEPRTHQAHIRTFGMTESGVAQTLAGLEEKHEGLTLGYRAHFPEIEVKVHVRAGSAPEAERRSESIADEVRALLGDAVFGGRSDSFAEAVGRALRNEGKTLAVAESCTGGRVGEMLTRVPGASSYLLLDAVVYANSAKEAVLGVDREILRAHGAVSAQTAAAMAEGALRVAGADIAVSVTGIAGPDGGTEDKPVGTIWFGLARRGERTITKHRKLPWGRERVQILASYIALELVRRSALGRTLDLAER